MTTLPRPPGSVRHVDAGLWDRLRRVDPRIWDALLALGVVAGGVLAFALREHRPDKPAVYGFALMVVAGSSLAWRRVGLGLAVKHQVAAIAGTLVWLLAAEGILSGVVPDVAMYFPGAAGFAVVGINAADLLTPALGALLLGTYAVVAVAAGGILMQRPDIT
jgi:hypothetical protein